MRRIALIVTVWFGAAGIAAATTDKPVLLQSPTLSQTGIVFVTAGDLWMVSRSGGEAAHSIRHSRNRRARRPQQ